MYLLLWYLLLIHYLKYTTNLFFYFSAAAYWLFVVNGPTPVVKARIEDVPLEDEETDWTAIAFQILKTYFIPVIQQET